MSESVQASLKELRWEYAAGTLNRADLAEDPLAQFKTWFEEAVSAGIREPNAMTLSTISLEGYPHSRIVLMKDYTEEGITLFTNYLGRKGQELAAAPVASLLFFWKELERQAHICGKVERTSAEESDAYFYSRPYISRIGAWASRQSEEIPNRKWLDERVEKYEARFPETDALDCVPRPDFWGGYRVIPASVEFWQGQPGRKHDRFIYRRDPDSDAWVLTRHSP